MPKRTVDATIMHPVLVDLALQGGGSHGAFTWGVLDRLLEEPRLEIEAISGTSAGAMNGAVLVSGFMQGGANGARAALDAYWSRVADAARFSPIQRSPLDRLMNNQALHHRHQRAHWARACVPQQGNHAGGAPRLGLFADDVPGGRDRW
jgi:NTE family protein